MSLFDAFFLSMIFVTGFVAVVVIVSKFFKDMTKEYKRDSVHNKSVRNSFKYNRNNAPMAVRNK